MKTLRKSLAAAAWMAVSGLCMCSPAPSQAADGGIWNDPEISAAVEKARHGQTEEIMRLTSRAKPNSQWRPVKKNLPQYHECLGPNENPLVQFFAVAAVSRFKDKSSVEPLQKFVMTAQRRVQGGTLPREEAVMLHLAVGAAVETLGEIDGDNDLSVAFLGTLLKHDIPKEWGGAVAHSALSKKGRPGLRRLLEESLTAEGAQINYICSAVSKINDPALVGDLYAACLCAKYPYRVRFSALSAIASLRTKVPEAEQLVIDILMNEGSDLRAAAVYRVSEFGKTNARELLWKLRNASITGDERLTKAMDETLPLYDAGNTLDGGVTAILSSATSDVEKKRLCSMLESMDKTKITQNATTVASCLGVVDSTGTPLNAARVSVWRTLYRSTGIKYPLTLAYEDDRVFEYETRAIMIELRNWNNREGNPPNNQGEKEAMEEVRRIVTRWDKPQTGKQGGDK